MTAEQILKLLAELLKKAKDSRLPAVEKWLAAAEQED